MPITESDIILTGFMMILAFLIPGSYLAISFWIEMVTKVTKAYVSY